MKVNVRGKNVEITDGIESRTFIDILLIRSVEMSY